MSNRDDFAEDKRLFKEFADKRLPAYRDTYTTEMRIFGVLEIIERTATELLIAVSLNDMMETAVMRDPRIIRAIKEANSRGVKVFLVISADLYEQIRHLIPEIELIIFNLYELSIVTADNNAMAKISCSDEARATFCFGDYPLIPLVMYDFLKKYGLLPKE